MFSPFTNGRCPECLLKNVHEDMVLNHDDFWECPTCHLQAHSVSGGMLAILRGRGKGVFSASNTKASEYVDGWVLTKDAGLADLQADIQGFRDEEALRRFLQHEIRE